MNFRHTALLFGLCLTMLWLFGFMLAYKKVVVEGSYILPSMQRAEKDDFESVVIERQSKDKAAEVFTFRRVNDAWYYEEKGQRLRVENYNITKIIDALKDAKKNDNAAVQAGNLDLYDINKPALTVTVLAHLKKDDNRKKEWKFYYGKDGEEGKDGVGALFAYVNSSDFPGRVFAVDKNRLEALFFKDPHHLRSRRLFNFGNPTEVSALELKKGDGGLEITKNDEGVWRIQKPPLGFADFEGVTADPKSLAPPPKTETGVKGLIAAIAHIQVDVEEDFLPPGELEPLLLEDGKELARIQITSPPERAFMKEEKVKKEPTRETLLIGKKLGTADKYYGRLLGDQGAFLINAKYLEPIFQAIKDPSSLRGMDVLPIDTKNVDYIALAPGGPEITLFHPEGKSWHLLEAKGKPEKAGDKAVLDLLEALQGKRQIQKFHDDGDAKKIDDQLGLNTPVAEATLYINGLDKEKKEDKKDDKKEAKKDEKKEDKVEAPTLVKDAKPAVKLSFGKTEGDLVWVKRDLGDKNISRFALPKAILDRVRPADARLAYLDTALPSFNQFNITQFDLIRGNEKFELEQTPPHGWTFKGQAATGSNPVKSFEIILAIDKIAKAEAKKWLKKIGPKDELEPYGLKAPSLVTQFTFKTEQPITPKGAVAFLANDHPLLVAACYLGHRAADKVETVTLKFGKENDEEKDKRGVFAMHSGTDVLFLAPTDLVSYLRELDVRDRSVVLNFQPAVDAGLIGQVAGQALGGLVLASPLAANQVLQFDPAKVKALKLAVRTKEELRNFTFQKNPKDKTWTDQSGLQEFNLDSEKVNQLIEEWSKLKADRLVGFGGPKVEHKLSPLEAALRAEIFLDDGRSFTFTVGGLFEQRQYFAHTSASPEQVFFVIANRVEPLLRGASHFAKERLAAGP